MNISFRNDLEKNIMVATVTLKKRQRANEPLINLNENKITELVKNQYTPPEG